MTNPRGYIFVTGKNRHKLRFSIKINLYYHHRRKKNVQKNKYKCIKRSKYQTKKLTNRFYLGELKLTFMGIYNSSGLF